MWPCFMSIQSSALLIYRLNSHESSNNLYYFVLYVTFLHAIFPVTAFIFLPLQII
uniref:Uncharacterized protein n=1 Tax=Octopus bimaculoides TaxID=37653 RepID=A0A0L8IFF3_OCTBM